MAKRVIPVALLFALIAILGWKLAQQQRQIDDLKASLAREESARDQAARERTEAQKHLQLALDDQRRVSAQTAAPSDSDTTAEDVLTPWLAKIQALKDYLKKHPEAGIPQIAKLTTKDWLNVTSGNDTYATEADLRSALAQVRATARGKSVQDLQEALRDYLAANNNQPPTDSHQLAQYLPSTEDPAILDTVQANPSGKLPGARNPSSTEFLYSPPIDPWDSTNYYSPNGWSSMGTNNLPPIIASAIATATRDNGVAPTDPSQITGYPGISKINPEQLRLIFGALTTKL